ncbi:MAG: hypothetical protein AAF725_07450 [Acidobacteriota bacterium]
MTPRTAAIGRGPLPLAAAASPIRILLAAWVILLAPCPLWAQPGTLPQVEEEDLDESQNLASEPFSMALDPAELGRLFADAEEVFTGADRPTALPLYGHLVDILESAGELEKNLEQLLVRSLLRRGDIYFEVGGAELAADSLRRLLELDPALQPSLSLASPRLIAALDTLRQQTLAELNLILDPPDAAVAIDGQPRELRDGTLWTAAGERTLTVQRPGYESLLRPLELRAGRSATLELSLVRSSAILRLNTRPQGAEVLIDGEARGLTAGTAAEGFLPQGAGALYRREEFSDEMVIEGLESGLRVLEVRKDGFRSYRMELQIQDTIDYQMPPVVLEPESGQLIFKNFPVGAQILVDGEPQQPDVPGVTRPRITLPPGSYHVTVAAGPSRMFSTRLQLSDRQTMEVEVRLRPGLALLGVLGRDRQSAENLRRGLRIRLTESERWAFIDRSPEAPSTLERAGLTASSLTAASAPGGSRASALDWAAIQAAVDRAAPGLLYVLAVLDEDSAARQATVWVWGSAPAPARPDRVTIPLGDSEALAAFARQLDRTVPLTRPSMGALVIDSDASDYPVLAHVTPAGAAEAAELLPGDAIVGIAGVAVASAAQVAERIGAAESGESLELVVQGVAGTRAVKVRLGASPRVLVHEPGLLESVAFADLVLRSARAQPAQRWLIQLNQALIQKRAGEYAKAVQILRRIRAPQTSHGVGQATVDYELGLALDRLGPDLRDEARQALERSVALPGARRLHEDEAWLQPRARARLERLGGRR